jgi:putative spermidine/putrescine transport system ATP-binding protein
MSVNVTIEDLAVTLGGAQVLEGVSLDVAEGEFVTLLGPSGSGKTTTLNVLAGFIRHTGGRVALGGTVVDDLPPHERNIGFVFQNYALFPHMTVAENVAYPLVARKIGKRKREPRVREVLELVRLPQLADRSVRSLSGGQQQRIALARALVFEPNLLLLDEPLAALDKQLRDAMQLEIRRIHERTGMTTVAVTHDQVEAMTMSDRVAILDAGRISQVGTPREVYQRPANLFVASFLGEANLLEARDGTVPALGVVTSGARDGTAVIRPEDLLLGRPDEGGVAGAVDAISFQGSRQRVLVSLESGERLVVSAPVDDGAARLGAGDAVGVRASNPAVHSVAERSEQVGAPVVGAPA